MHLYNYDPAPNPQRLVYFMKLKGIELPTTQIDLGKLEQLKPEYHAINASGTVPCLVLDSGEQLTEVIAICQYLECLNPAKPLMGNNALEQAQVLEWDHKIFTTLLSAVADMLRNGNPAFEGRALPGPVSLAQIPALVERGQIRIQHCWEVLNAALEGKNFLVGTSITLADIDLYVAMNFAGWVRERVPETASNLLAFRDRMKALLDQA